MGLYCHMRHWFSRGSHWDALLHQSASLCSKPLHGQVDTHFFRSSLFGVGLLAYIILIVSRSPALSYFAVYLAIWQVKFHFVLSSRAHLKILVLAQSILRFVWHILISLQTCFTRLYSQLCCLARKQRRGFL